MKTPVPHPASSAVRTVVEPVAEDIYKVVIPVPFRGLGHINCYLLRGPDGWDIVDTGMATPEALAAWDAAWTQLHITPADIHQIILTHHHPDHLGLAGRFQQAAQEAGSRTVPVRMSARENEIVEIIWTDREERNGMMEDFFVQCGFPEPADINFSAREVEWMRHMLTPFAEMVDVLVPGEVVGIGARQFEVHLTPGHSDGHLIFLDRADRLLLVGDHVLPHITPNIAYWPGTEHDPLGRYMLSLDTLKKLGVERALPGHGPEFHTWQDRLVELDGHHAERLDAMEYKVEKGATVFDVTQRVFNVTTLDRHQARMAVAETLAHLEHLVDRGRLRRVEDEAWWYERL
ncbi:MAG: MBL fold metallo-hydrolase [Rhodothermales bacterium]